MLQKGEKYCFQGYGDVHVERYYFEKILRSELRVIGSWSNVSAPFPGREWDTSVSFFSNGKINTDTIITHRISMENGPEMFEKLLDRKELFGKVILYP